MLFWAAAAELHAATSADAGLERNSKSTTHSATNTRTIIGVTMLDNRFVSVRSMFSSSQFIKVANGGSLNSLMLRILADKSQAKN
jgi:hypothetical protein